MTSKGSRVEAKLKKLQERKDILDGLKKSRNGSSRLDDVDMDDENDAVYDLMDEDSYAKLVEERRAADDFVVDDDGCGYRDDGEEVLGIHEDELDAKKRGVEGAEEFNDDGTKKKMQRLQRAAAQGIGATNTMFNFVRTGQSALQRPSANLAGSSAVEMLDIDSLLNAPGSMASQRNQKAMAPPRNVVNVPSIRNMTYRALPASLEPTHVGQMSYDQDYADADDGYDNAGQDDYASDEPAISDIKENIENIPKTFAKSETVGKDASDADAAEAKEDIRDEGQSGLDETAIAGSEKISFTKGVRKLQRPVQANKPLSGLTSASSAGSLVVPGINMDEETDIMSVANGSDKTAYIDPAYWIQHSGAQAGAKVTSPDVTSAPENEFVNMFWTDATESNGVIYLFGRVPVTEPNAAKRFVSCCVSVHGNQRNLFVLARATGDGFTADGKKIRAGMQEVYQDLTKMLVPSIIPKTVGGGFKCKPVQRKYAFEHGEIPREETEYLKVVYSAKHGVPSPTLCERGTSSIERIFGATNSALELFLLKRKLMGPCWITINNPRIQKDSVSWCRIEVGVDDPKSIVKISSGAPEAPPLVSMCISMKTVLNPATHTHEVVALSAVVHSKVEADGDTKEDKAVMRRFTLVRQLGATCGPTFPAVFPHDMAIEAKKNAQSGFQTMLNERALLSLFLLRIGQEDPDILASHNLFGFEFDVLLARAVANKLPQWSKFGRLRKTRPPKSISDRDFAAGRILCDTYKAAKEFVRETTYSLTHLSLSQLSYERVEVDPVDVPRYFSSSQDIMRISNHTACDAMLVQKLMLKLQVVPLTKNLTNLSGNLWSRTIRGARAERIEYLLLHEFYSLKFILPERKAFENKKVGAVGKSGLGTGFDDDDDEDVGKVGGHSRKRGKAAYAGGLVLEPKKGLYDTYILLLDFNSLYPSIIQEYNLCFTTVNWTKYMHDQSDTTAEGKKKAAAAADKAKKGSKGKSAASSATTKNTSVEDDPEDDIEDELVEEEADEGEQESAKSLPPLPDTSSAPGVLPRVIKSLVDRRREVKNLLKKERDPLKMKQLDIRQKAFKLTANSMYGCLGFSFSRFYARPIAAMVTSMGREALQRTVDQATNQLHLDVIYGDTDSVMINTNCTDLAEVKKMGNEVKKEVNKLYKSLELDLDGIFKSMLLLKKKKYAALVINEVDGVISYDKEMKGLDLVRRDWCPLSQDTGKYVVDEILSGKPKEEIVEAIHSYMSKLAENVRAGKIDLGKFVVTKGLNKNPKDYPDSKTQPHLQVALAMLAANKPVNIGDHIPYVICSKGASEGKTPAQRAFHPDEVFRSQQALSQANSTAASANLGVPPLKGNETSPTSVVPELTEAQIQAQTNLLTIDVEWYLSQQILPPISRLCEPIEGTSIQQISIHLGLDASKFAPKTNSDDLNLDDWGFTPRSLQDDQDRFKDCVKLICHCTSCQNDVPFTGVFSDTGGSGLNCGACGAMYYGRTDNAAACYGYLSNRVSLLVRQCVKRYYDCWLQCDDRTCNKRTTQQSVMGYTCTSDCHGRMVQEYDESALHTQLKYLESLFDYERARKKRDIKVNEIHRDDIEIFRLLNKHMSHTIDNNAFNWIRPSLWSTIFSGAKVAAASNGGTR